MVQIQMNTATVISDAAHKCLFYFNKVMVQHDDTTLTYVLYPSDAVAASSNQNHHPYDFLGLRESFLLWTNCTGALTIILLPLDARLRDFPGMSAIITELLIKVSSNLRRGEFVFLFSFQCYDIFEYPGTDMPGTNEAVY